MDRKRNNSPKNQGANLQLTVSLLVSNSITTIRKCMESLRPLLEAIPSELIVVDTGGTDGSIEIAREYADQVIPFSWCNNFSKARNAGLEKASGEWFLFLDDDEWFENVDELIRFFQTGEYKKYESASYEIRNYLNSEGTQWSATRYYRMVKIHPETKFVSPIHEILDPIYSPEKDLQCYVHHYGYVFETEEDKKKHADRNIGILKAVLKENPEDLRLWLQLAKEYTTIGSLEESAEISRKNLQKTEQSEKRTPEQIAVAGWHMNNYLYIKINQGKAGEACREAKSMLKYLWINRVTKNNLLYLLTNLSFLFEDYKECGSYALNYFETCRGILKNSGTKIGEVIAEQSKSYSEESRWKTAFSGLQAAGHCKERERQTYFIRKIQEFGLSGIKEEDFPVVIISALEVQDMINVNELLDEIPLQQWEKYLCYFRKNASLDLLKRGYEASKQNSSCDVRVSALEIQCCEKLLQEKEMENMTFSYLDELLQHYIKRVLNFNSLLFREEIFVTEMEVLLPDNCRFCNKLQQIYEAGVDDLKKVRILKEAVKFYPTMASSAKIYITKMQQETEAATREFLQLAAMIKKSIRVYIASGQIENARITLQQLEQLIPGDPEVAELKEMARLV